MTYTDRYGEPLSTTSAEAAERYSESLDAVLAFDGGVLPAVDLAIEADPEFALAHIHRARALQVEGRMPEALQSRERAQALATNATAEEQAHIAIISLAIDGNGPAALAAIKEQLKERPRNTFCAGRRSVRAHCVRGLPGPPRAEPGAPRIRSGGVRR